MSWLLDIHLIRLFNFYLTYVFILTTLVNIRDYRHMLAVARSLPGRWPRLLQLLKNHSHILLNWRMGVPLLTSLALLVVQLIVTRFIAPKADEKLTIEYLLPIWPVLPLIVATSAAMIVVDVYANWPLPPFDRASVEQQLDQAEFWLRSWTAPVVRVLSLGYINPRSMVAAEVPHLAARSEQAAAPHAVVDRLASRFSHRLRSVTVADVRAVRLAALLLHGE